MKYFVMAALCLLASQHALANKNNLPFFVRGPASAPVTVILSGDYQCPFTKRANETVAELQKQMPADIKVIFRNFPLDFHNQAMPAAKTAICAGEQGRFWETHDYIFSLSTEILATISMKDIAQKMGLNLSAFDTCYNALTTEEKIRRDMQEGELLGQAGAPYYILVGPEGLKRVAGAYPIDEMKKYILEVKGSSKR